jgi:hypothetical protein
VAVSVKDKELLIETKKGKIKSNFTIKQRKEKSI